MLLDLTNSFHRHCLSVVFRTVHFYNLSLGQPIHTRFCDLDLVSRSQVCRSQKTTLKKKIKKFLSFKYCMVLT